jgi:hypothetical protein
MTTKNKQDVIDILNEELPKDFINKILEFFNEIQACKN